MAVEVLGSDGRIKDRTGIAPQGVVFSAGVTAATNIGSTATKVGLTFEFGQGWDTTNNRWIPPIPGYYRFSAHWRSAVAQTAGGQLGLYLYKNGSLYKSFSYKMSSGNTDGTGGTVISYANGSTDYFELWAAGNVAGNNSVDATTGFLQANLIGTSVGVISEPWHVIGATGEPTFQNLWANDSGATTRFCKDPHGWVHLAGRIRSGTMGSTAFVLPAGYRPGQLIILATVSHNGTNDLISELRVDTNGNVIPNTGSSSNWFSLDLPPWRAEL